MCRFLSPRRVVVSLFFILNTIIQHFYKKKRKKVKKFEKILILYKIKNLFQGFCVLNFETKPNPIIQITEPIAGISVSLKKNKEKKIKPKATIVKGTNPFAKGVTNPLGSKSLVFLKLR